jgi:predicted nucleotide-binding protein
MEIVDQIKTMLELAELDYEVVVEEESTAIPVPDKVFSAMRNCNAAIICVTAEENADEASDTLSINENVLIEIGAAFVLYEKRVVLVWDRRVEVPSNLQGLYRCEFSGDELSWSAGMKLMKAVRNFKTE